MPARKTQDLAVNNVINLAAERARRRAKFQYRGMAPAAQSVPRLPAATRPRHRHPRALQGDRRDE